MISLRKYILYLRRGQITILSVIFIWKLFEDIFKEIIECSQIPPNLVSPVEMEPLQPTSPTPSSFPLLQPEDWSLTSRIALASIGSQGTMGTLLLTGFVSQNFNLSEDNTISENANTMNILLYIFCVSVCNVKKLLKNKKMKRWVKNICSNQCDFVQFTFQIQILLLQLTIIQLYSKGNNKFCFLSNS